jgi:hypothetical protein
MMGWKPQPRDIANVVDLLSEDQVPVATERIQVPLAVNGARIRRNVAAPDSFDGAKA